MKLFISAYRFSIMSLLLLIVLGLFNLKIRSTYLKLCVFINYLFDGSGPQNI
jgi:hypothetical protein